MATRVYSNSPYNLEGGGKVSGRSKEYSDLDFTFLAKPGSGDIYKKTGAAAIKQSIHNIIMTDLGERPFQPTLGTNVRGLLFELLDTPAVMDIENRISFAIEQHERRVKVLGVAVSESDNTNSINVTIRFQIISSAEIIESVISMERIR